MFYNDDATRKSEERFRELLEEARNLSESNLQKVKDALITLTPYVNKLSAIKNPTPEEKEMLYTLQDGLKKLTEELDIRRSILFEHLYRQSITYYNHIKKLAAEGNEDARKIYEDLKVSYQATLNDNLGKN